MSKSKKPIIYLTCFFLVLSSVIIPYYNTKASDLVVASGLASSGVALLGLLAMSGVGMELENNKKFNELSDDEKSKIENGLVSNFEDAALQRGASLEKIRNWTSDLCSGVLDKASECWDIFKEWAKDVHITGDGGSINENMRPISPSSILGFHFVNRFGVSCGVTPQVVSELSSKYNLSDVCAYIIYEPQSSWNSAYAIEIVYAPNLHNYYGKGSSGTSKKINVFYNPSDNTYSVANSGTSGTYGGYADLTGQYKQVGIFSSYPVYNSSSNSSDTNFNGLGMELVNDIFSTNTDYLERLRGQEKEQVEVIDVTDIKNPIIESQGNSIARIDWNRGTNNNNNNDDDEQTIKGGLVPADVWYESLDDYIDGQNNAIETYDNHIEENPEDKDKYFISPSPIVNISQYYDVLPVVPVPTGGTIVNNYYTYNNYNTFNNTIYNEPYDPNLVPNIPMLVFENKFPFCIPWDIFNFVSAFYVEKAAPRIDIPFPIKGANGLDVEIVTIDLSGYEYLSTIIRVMFFVLFLVGLMLVTRQLIKG